MAQRDYVSRGRSNTRRKKTSSRRKSGSSGASKTLIALAAAVLVTFAGGLYFIAHHKPEDSAVLPHQAVKGNGLPPKPEERWRYIKELENRQLGVSTPTEPTAGGEIESTSQLTDEQRQLLEQMKADMQRQPTQLSEVPYNDPSQAARSSSSQRQQTVVTQPTYRDNAQTAPARPQPVPVPRTEPVRQDAAKTQESIRAREAAKDAAAKEAAAREAAKEAARAQEIARAEAAKAQAAEAAKARADAAKAEAAKNDAEKQKQDKSQRWLVQCGSFKSMEPAESVRAELAFAGVESRIASSGGWNRIILGPYSTRAAADKSAQKLKGMGYSNCIPLASGG